jgi:TetR/AcrR family transcriptional regulator, transcriptional repressor for nem operon
MARPFEFDKDEILERAMLLFWRKGYFHTSFQDIVEHLQLSRSSIYNSFSDKRLLYIESLKYYINKESRALTNSVSKLPPNPNSIKKILQQIAYGNSSNENPKGCLVVNSCIELANHDEEIKQIIEGNMKEVIGAFTDFIKEGQKQGNINYEIKAEELASSLFHQITALRVIGKVIKDKAHFNKTIDAFINLFIKPK